MEKYDNEIVVMLMKNRDNPDHIRRAERLNEEIERRKAAINELREEKLGIKAQIQRFIDEMLDFNKDNEMFFRRRHEELTELFAGSETLGELESFMEVFQRAIAAKDQLANRPRSAPSTAHKLG
jgi:hypothetical protein